MVKGKREKIYNLLKLLIAETPDGTKQMGPMK